MNNNIPNPQHIAIIMDGNRRWARERGLPVLEGHRRVAGPVLEKLIEHATLRGIRYLTVWAFSTENWGRAKDEVSGVMQILRHGFKTYGMKMHKKGIRIKVIGDLTKFPPDIQKSIGELITLTNDNKRITVVFALNYGGRDEILRAVNNLQINKPASPAGGSTNLQINEDEFSQLLDTKDIPDPEFIIRTGGEQRLSGFLLWQSEYSELYFPAFYMPDFTPERFDEALEEYTKRKRRFGK